MHHTTDYKLDLNKRQMEASQYDVLPFPDGET